MDKYFYISTIIEIIVGYLFGSIPTGYLFCKAHGINIFEVGSKNPGSTNVGRVLGHKAGVKVFLLDILKTIVPIFICVIITRIIFNNADIIYGLDKKTVENCIIFYTGCGVVTGHNFPCYINFRGGKGITCTVAILIYFNFIYALVFYLFHKVVGKITGYVSLASILTLAVLGSTSAIFSVNKIPPFNFENSTLLLPAILFLILFGIARHASNIKRLINGTESKITKEKVKV